MACRNARKRAAFRRLIEAAKPENINEALARENVSQPRLQPKVIRWTLKKSGELVPREIVYVDTRERSFARDSFTVCEARQPSRKVGRCRGKLKLAGKGERVVIGDGIHQVIPAESKARKGPAIGTAKKPYT